ncbi:hypothetical protein TPY_1397 [Sulfobacillus acidophilus TPY]|nr:hypothetical protein TPY_1397 [Sulfobacillus acidophilus TPY]
MTVTIKDMLLRQFRGLTAQKAVQKDAAIIVWDPVSGQE